jgi:hypothetical protein
MNANKVVYHALQIYQLGRVGGVAYQAIKVDESQLIDQFVGKREKEGELYPICILKIERPSYESNIPLLAGKHYVIGRSYDVEVTVGDEKVSRLHLSLHIHSDGRATIRDLDSLNGTTLNDQLLLVGDVAEFKEGDVLKMGESLLSISYFSPDTLGPCP